MVPVKGTSLPPLLTMEEREGCSLSSTVPSLRTFKPSSSAFLAVNDPQVGRERDSISGSRERNLKTTGGTDRGLGVSTDCCKAKSDERQRA